VARSYTSKKRDTGGDVLTFELDGVVFSCPGRPNALDLAELGRLAEAGADSVEPEALAAIGNFLTAIMGKREYDRFRRHCREHDTDDETLMEVLAGIVEDIADRPTERPSTSPDGPQSTPGTARVVSFSRGTVETIKASEPESQPTPAVVSYG
jgi:hypothetical protein